MRCTRLKKLGCLFPCLTVQDNSEESVDSRTKQDHVWNVMMGSLGEGPALSHSLFFREQMFSTNEDALQVEKKPSRLNLSTASHDSGIYFQACEEKDGKLDEGTDNTLTHRKKLTKPEASDLDVEQMSGLKRGSSNHHHRCSQCRRNQMGSQRSKSSQRSKDSSSSWVVDPIMEKYRDSAFAMVMRQKYGN